jgi:hypothetical protein
MSRLPPEIREKVAELHLAGRTNMEIMTHLHQLDLPPGTLPNYSNLAKYVKRLDVMAAQVQQSRDLAKIIVGQLGDAPETQQARLNIELMHGILTEMFFAQSARGTDKTQSVTLSPAQIHLLCKSLDHLTHAQQTDQDSTLNLRMRIAAEQNRRVEAAAADVAMVTLEEGLTPERVALIQAKIAGLRLPLADDA